MMKNITLILNQQKVKSKFHNHHNPEKWFTIYYYKDNKRTRANISKDLPVDVSSFKEFRYDTFYKVQSLSDSNEIFDYYRIRKPTFSRRKKRYVQGISRKKKKKKELPIPKKVILTKQDLIVNF